jgi:catechol 2,3-dioxygenase-like lactoylglutathione lyase family enzyme
VDYKLELIIVPVSDLDRAKAFYMDQAGFTCDVDHSAGEDFRIVQLTPTGSACSITLMRNDAPGTLQGVHLVVNDIEAARAELVGRGLAPSEPYHFTETGQTPGLSPQRQDYETFMSFEDPDGNGWVVQEFGFAAAS